MKAKHGRPRAGTQAATILEILERNANRWVGLDLLMFEARRGAVHSQVAKLRAYGFAIVNRQEVVNGTRHSSYKLHPAPKDRASA